MKYENKWLIIFLLNIFGYLILIIQSFSFIIYTFLFINGYIVFLYEFNLIICNIEFLLCLYSFPFIVLKAFREIKKSWKVDFIE